MLETLVKHDCLSQPDFVELCNHSNCKNIPSTVLVTSNRVLSNSIRYIFWFLETYEYYLHKIKSSQLRNENHMN